MVSAAVPVDIVIAVVEPLGTFSEGIWAVVLPTREAKIENLTNKVGLIWIEVIILIKLSIAFEDTTSFSS